MNVYIIRLAELLRFICRIMSFKVFVSGESAITKHSTQHRKLLAKISGTVEKKQPLCSKLYDDLWK